MTRWIPVCLLLAAPLALAAQSAPAWQLQAGAVWTQPVGDLRQISPDHGWGVMLGAQAQETPQGALRLFAEYRRFQTADGGRCSLSDAGLLLTGTITGPLYGFGGATAERIHLPDHRASIKLGTRAGLGWALGRHGSLEAAYTYAALDGRSVNATEASLVFTF